MPVVRRPRTRILVAGASDAPDVLGPMLRALVERDGGAVAVELTASDARRAAADLVAGADVVLIAGSASRRASRPRSAASRSSPGARPALPACEDTIIVLLPGLPAACFWSYELVAGRVVRCRGGRDPGMPYAIAAPSNDPQDRIGPGLRPRSCRSASTRRTGDAVVPLPGRPLRRVCAPPRRRTASRSCRRPARAAPPGSRGGGLAVRTARRDAAHG